MTCVSQDPRRIASTYTRQHGSDAVVYLDGDISKALGQQRWTDYKTLQDARRRLAGIGIFEQI